MTDDNRGHDPEADDIDQRVASLWRHEMLPAFRRHDRCAQTGYTCENFLAWDWYLGEDPYDTFPVPPPCYTCKRNPG